MHQLTDQERELLALLAEELGEAVQAVGKILRHGPDNCHPKRPKPTNRAQLEMELGDVSAAMALLERSEFISGEAVAGFREAKLGRVGRYLYHQGEA